MKQRSAPLYGPYGSGRTFFTLYYCAVKLLVQDMYESLRKVGFTADEVEQAMTATVCLGGDLYDALDWLCLNLPNGKYFTPSLEHCFIISHNSSICL